MSIKKILNGTHDAIQDHVDKMIERTVDVTVEKKTKHLQEFLRMKSLDLNRAITLLDIAEKRVKSLNEVIAFVESELTAEKSLRKEDGKHLASMESQREQSKRRIDYLEKKVMVNG